MSAALHSRGEEESLCGGQPRSLLPSEQEDEHEDDALQLYEDEDEDDDDDDDDATTCSNMRGHPSSSAAMSLATSCTAFAKTKQGMALFCGLVFVIFLAVNVSTVAEHSTASKTHKKRYVWEEFPKLETCAFPGHHGECHDEEEWDLIQRWETVLMQGSTTAPSLELRPGSEASRKYSECMKDYRQLRATQDPECTLVWMQRMLGQKVVALSNVLEVVPFSRYNDSDKSSVKVGQSGGMLCTFEDGVTKSWWKPCIYGSTGNGEDYRGEIAAFHLDRLAGFYRTPAIIPYHFTAAALDVLAEQSDDPDIRRKLDTVLEVCGDPGSRAAGGAEGAAVGWSPFPLYNPVHQHRTLFCYDLKKADQRKFRSFYQISRKTSPAHLKRALEGIQFYMFEVLTGFVGKWDHNLYVMKRNCDTDPRCSPTVASDESEAEESSDHVLGVVGLERPDEYGELDLNKFGLLLYIDNDRASFRHSSERKNHLNATTNALWQHCRFPERLARRILLFGKAAEEERQRTLGSVLRTTLQYVEVVNDPLFSALSEINVNKNVLFLARIIQRCIDRYDVETVLIPEPWMEDAP